MKLAVMMIAMLQYSGCWIYIVPVQDTAIGWGFIQKRTHLGRGQQKLLAVGDETWWNLMKLRRYQPLQHYHAGSL